MNGEVPGFERLGVIAAGVGSTVLRARDLRTGRTCALKLMRSFEALAPEGRARFEQEAGRLLGFSHPNVVRVWDVGTRAGTAWIAQELVDGPSLQQVLDALGGPLPLAATLAIGVQVGGALAALAAADLAHLDISPANLLLAHTGEVKLCDFGLGFELGLSQRLAGVQLSLQAVDYVAPELVEGELPPDARTDVYGLGATLHRCLAGRPPFAGTDLEARLQAILHESPPDLRELVPSLPAAIAEAVAELMARDRDDRPLPADVAGLLHGLAEEELGVQRGDPRWPVETLAGLVQQVRRTQQERGPRPPEPATLVRFRGTGRTIERCLAPGEQFEIGRSSETDVPLPYGSISRRHARVRCDHEGVWLEDLGSANGSSLNGRRLGEATLLRPGDMLRLGKLRFEVALSEILRPPPETTCRLCGVQLERPTADPERAVCASCRERAEADRRAGEDRLRRLLESLGYQVEAPLTGSGQFHRWLVRQGAEPWLCSLVELGQRAASAYAEGSRGALALSHPAILPVKDVLVRRGTLVVVSRAHPGPTLAARLRQRGALRASLVARVGCLLADALGHAAARGVRQALVRPELVLLGDDGQPQLLDVGLAPALLEVHRARVGRAEAEPCFEAPEVDDLRAMTPAALVYALAATLGFALTGHAPAEVRGGERFDNLPLTMVGTIPSALAALLARATSPDPSERPATPEHLRDALGALAQEELEASTPGSGEEQALDEGATHRTDSGSSSATGPSRAERFRTQRIDRDSLDLPR